MPTLRASANALAVRRKLQTRLMEYFKIVRFFKDGTAPRVIKSHVSLAEAQEHCNRPDTEKAGVWFDGYQRELKPRKSVKEFANK